MIRQIPRSNDGRMFVKAAFGSPVPLALSCSCEALLSPRPGIPRSRGAGCVKTPTFKLCANILSGFRRCGSASEVSNSPERRWKCSVGTVTSIRDRRETIQGGARQFDMGGLGKRHVSGCGESAIPRSASGRGVDIRSYGNERWHPHGELSHVDVDAVLSRALAM
jgi:hypothetical protein